MNPVGRRAGQLVDLAAAKAGIDEGAKADVGDGARPMGRGIPQQMAHDALREDIGEDLVLLDHLPDLRRKAPVRAHRALEHPVVRQVVEPFVLAVALCGAEDQREIPGMPGLEKTVFQLERQLFGKAGPDKAAGGNGRAVRHKVHRLAGGQDLD